jgi:hypothetical protein
VQIKREIRAIVQAIHDVWDKKSDGVRKDNPEFVNWLLKKQLDEVEEKGYELAAMVKEYADCFLIIVKWFDAQGLDAKTEVMKRLKTRHQGKTEEISKKYDELWRREH